MADQSVKITNIPDSGSRHRVAFDLMVRIATAEPGTGSEKPGGPRAYYLALFRECRETVGY